MGTVSLGNGAKEGNANQGLIEGEPLSYELWDTLP